MLPDDAILTNGAGNYATWVHRFHRFRRFATQAAPTSGSMGYGTPAAVAAKALFPEREVIAFAGDGCFLMNGQEFATAVQYDLPIIVIVVNNGIYGTIRMHQERDYPGRVVGTDLKNPDFAALARAYGGHGETVEKTADFAPAFERARASGKPAIIEIKLDPEAITPTRTLTRDPGEALNGEGHVIAIESALQNSCTTSYRAPSQRPPAPARDRRSDRPDARRRSTAGSSMSSTPMRWRTSTGTPEWVIAAGMAGQRLGAAEADRELEDLQRVEEGEGRVSAALDVEGEGRAGAACTARAKTLGRPACSASRNGR